MQAKVHRRRFCQEASAPFNADSSHCALQFCLAPEAEAKTGKEFMGTREAAAWLAFLFDHFISTFSKVFYQAIN